MEKLIAKRREELTLQRAFIENNLNQFREGLAGLPDNIVSQIDPPADMTPEAVFPSLYTDEFSVERYIAEKAAFQPVLDRAAIIKAKLEAQAKEALGIA